MKKPISLYVEAEDYEELKAVAAREGVPVAELVREAMAEYLARERREGASFADVAPRSLGRRLRGWTRDELYDEMVGERVQRGDE